jgi:hypothetical protein
MDFVTMCMFNWRQVKMERIRLWWSMGIFPIDDQQRKGGAGGVSIVNFD